MNKVTSSFLSNAFPIIFFTIYWCLNGSREPWKVWFWLCKVVVFKSKAAALCKFLSELSFLNLEGRSPDQGITGNTTWMNHCFLTGKEFHYDLWPKKILYLYSSHIFYWRKIVGVHNTCGNALELCRSTLKPKGWLNANVLLLPTITKLMGGYCPKLE